jgi:hypothetical protein
MLLVVPGEGPVLEGGYVMVVEEGPISVGVFGGRLEVRFTCFMFGWPRSTLDKTSPSKPDNVVVQFILFPDDKCNASI